MVGGVAGGDDEAGVGVGYRLRGGAPERIALDVVGDDSVGVVPWLEGRTPARMG